MFINIKTNQPADGQKVLVKLENKSITGALYSAISSEPSINFSPIEINFCKGCSCSFSSQVVSWMPLDALTS